VDTLLDVGCAAGLTGEALIALVAQYVGLDYSAAAVQEFKRRVPYADVQVGDCQDLPFADRTFSKGLVGSVLLCLDAFEAKVALSELRRVIRDRAYVSGNLDATRRVDVPGAGYIEALWMVPEEARQMAFEAGWKAVAIVPPSNVLPQASYMFDMVLW
jgi:SAM-dependent methyltransferase